MKLFYPLYLIIIFCISSISLFILYYHPIPNAYHSTPLRVPLTSTITTSEPLRLSFQSKNPILGASPIKPEDIVYAVNNERSNHNANPLRINELLMNAAQMRANIILKYQNFSHQDPNENIELGTVLPRVGYSFSYATENIGMGGTSANDFVSGFMHSTSHRINLLNPYLIDTGVGISEGIYDRYYVTVAVQLFAVPGSQDEYLGYTKDDLLDYKTRNHELALLLSPVTWTIGTLIQPNFFNVYTEKILQRQQTIVRSLVTKMEREEPLKPVDVSLILEYNHSLSLLTNKSS